MKITRRHFLGGVVFGFVGYLPFSNSSVINKIVSTKKNIPVEVFFDKNVDGDDYANAIMLGMDYCIKNGKTLYFSDRYRVGRAILLENNASFLGDDNAVIYSRESTPISILRADDKSNIKIQNINVDGGVISDVGKNYTRTIEFKRCSNIFIKKIKAGNNADWCISFIDSNNISLYNITIYSGGRGRPGGRDGIHFLDCNNFIVNKATIDSGDDCIGITTIKSSSYGIISNIIGTSEIGTIVACNEEQRKNKSYYSSTINNFTLSNIRVMKDGKARNIVRFYGYNPSTIIKDIVVENVFGISNSHGVYLGGVRESVLSGINVRSINGNGIYLTNVNGLKAKNNNIGSSLSDKNHGVSIFKSENITGKLHSKSFDQYAKVFISKSDNVSLVSK